MSDDNTSKDHFRDFLRSIPCGNPRCKELEAKLAEADRLAINRLDEVKAISSIQLLCEGELVKANEKLKVAVEALEFIESTPCPNSHDVTASVALEKIKGREKA